MEEKSSFGVIVTCALQFLTVWEPKVSPAEGVSDGILGDFHCPLVGYDGDFRVGQLYQNLWDQSHLDPEIC